MAPEHTHLQLAQRQRRHPATTHASGEVQPSAHRGAAHHRLHPHIASKARDAADGAVLHLHSEPGSVFNGKWTLDPGINFLATIYILEPIYRESLCDVQFNTVTPVCLFECYESESERLACGAEDVLGENSFIPCLEVWRRKLLTVCV